MNSFKCQDCGGSGEVLGHIQVGGGCDWPEIIETSDPCPTCHGKEMELVVEEDCQIVDLTLEDCADDNFDPYPECLLCTGKPIYRPLTAQEVEELTRQEGASIECVISVHLISIKHRRASSLAYKGQPVTLRPKESE